jgi:hypothetical protein
MNKVPDSATAANNILLHGGLGTVLAICLLAGGLLVAGLLVLHQVRSGKYHWGDSNPDPLRPHALQVLGLAFVLPVILVIGASGLLGSEAITALLGAIVGYLFGATNTIMKPPRRESPGDDRP